ncbi:MAG: AAA family ATPase [Dehalococcoidia bacterium]|nr:AAA family ATPase [Dehalococcoidia bacterium]
MQREITDDLDHLLDALPQHIARRLHERPGDNLLEVVLDLGRLPEARYPEEEVVLSDREVTEEDITYVVAHIGVFGDDNRAGIERTLHRISAIRNRTGRIVGLTCRIGRAVYGTISIIEDLVQSGKSILLLGRPGVGKTTMLREVARVLSDDFKKRVIIVDTSNEIAGDGDIPHPAIGRARRMQVPTPPLQHAVMIEAVENHMPEVIVIDEIGTELEAAAARTIAERGVQLVGTAHGNTLENLILNPTLSDLVGGIQSVTLGDEEARRRGTQKSILERKAPPTFDVVVEIRNWKQVVVHEDVASVVDSILRGHVVSPGTRTLTGEGEVVREEQEVTIPSSATGPVRRNGHTVDRRMIKVFPFGVSRSKLEQTIRASQFPVVLAERLEGSDAMITLRNYYRKKPQVLRDAETSGIPIHVLKNHTQPQMEQSLISILGIEDKGQPLYQALREAEDAISQVMSSETSFELSPQSSYIRRLQHQLAQRYNLSSRSTGQEPHRRVTILPGWKP